MLLKKWIISACLIMMLITWAGCGDKAPLPVTSDSVEPGSAVKMGDQEIPLLGTPIAVGMTLPSVPLVDSMTMKEIDLSQEKGKVLFLSIVPSIDTKVCEAQTHLLGEEGDKMAEKVERITISRDTPFAHQRFAEAGKLTDIWYLSDYKAGDFGRSLGLLVSGPMLLARSIIIVDTQGVVRYIQVSPILSYLPDMEKAFNKALELVAAK